MHNSNRSPGPRRSPPVVRPLIAALAVAGLAMPFAAYAATVQVKDGGDAGTGSTCTLRQAIASINAGANQAGCVATIVPNPFGSNDAVDLSLQTGTITLGGTQIDVTKPVALNGPAGGSSALTISGNNASRVFAATAGPLVINGLTIANGTAVGSGGCILALNGATGWEVDLNQSVVKGCTAAAAPVANSLELGGVGGGVAAGSVFLVQSTVSGNTAVAGGGIFAYYVQAKYSSIANNTVVATTCSNGPGNKYGCFGGGGVLAGGVIAAASSITGNTVNASLIISPPAVGVAPAATTTARIGLGGGVTVLYSVGVASVTGRARDARLTQLVKPFAAAPKYGGFMVLTTISGNRITGAGSNTPKYLGGGAFGYEIITIDATISGNSVTSAGFGSGVSGYLLALLNSTITGNTGIGGVVPLPGLMTPTSRGTLSAALASPSPLRSFLRGSKAPIAPAAGPTSVLSSALIANNTGPGGDIECPGTPCTFDGDHNLVRVVGTGVTVPPDTIVGKNPLLGPLADNGGFLTGAPGDAGTARIQTHLLLAGSPAIDRGTNLTNIPVDERGPNFPRQQGPAPDIGAVEIPGFIVVPALAPGLLGLLSALLGAVGWLGLGRRRRRSE